MSGIVAMGIILMGTAMLSRFSRLSVLSQHGEEVKGLEGQLVEQLPR